MFILFVVDTVRTNPEILNIFNNKSGGVHHVFGIYIVASIIFAMS